MLTFRDSLRAICPPWLRNGVAEKVLYSVAIHLDALIDSVTDGVKARFPGYETNETLGAIGQERRIRRGRGESDAIYAERLNRWLDDHATRGGPYALLSNIAAHYRANPFRVTLIYYSGRRFTMDTAGVITRDDIVWSPDANTAKWARWWLFYEWPYPVGTDGAWGDAGLWGDGGVWGSDLSPEDVYDIRELPREWNAAHPFGRVVLVTAGSELWGYPSGTWGDPGVWGGGGAVLDI